MGKPVPKPTVIISGSTLTFAQAGVYTIEYLPSGNVKIKVDGQQAVVLKPGEYASITSFSFAPGASLNGPVHVDGVIFHEADASGPFEINYNLNALIGSMISAHGIDYTLDNLVINGSTADTFKVLWDYLDDAYVAGGNPFNVALNETFVRLGVAYVDYLENGGTPFTDVTAKYTADSVSDADLIPEREQSMHDNLLGNLTSGAIDVRFSGDPALKAELLALIPDEYEARLLYEGNDTQVGGVRHDNVRAFDYDHGWDRPDYLDRDMNGTIDPLARDGGEMYYGDGNPTDDWNLIRHEGAQVELGLKVKHRGGDEYAEAYVDGDGIAHYNVVSGTQPGSPNRAEWNFDFAATDFSPDSNFKYVVELDFDPGAGTNWQILYSSDNPLDTALGGGNTFQNSSNVAFYRNFMDTDPGTPGIQAYAFGTGEFDLRISAYNAATNMFVISHEVVVHVI
jgi:hypothetical protein